MFPDDIKKFVIDSNKEKVLLKDFDSKKRNQDIKTKVLSNSQHHAQSSTNYGTASAVQP